MRPGSHSRPRQCGAIIAHWASVSVVRIKIASYLATLNHLNADLGILKRQQTLDWAKVGGNFQRAMDRHWYQIPTAIISFGYPYYLYDAPRVPTYINAYATMPTMQEAVLECLLGRAPWAGKSPHDAFCGLGDARY